MGAKFGDDRHEEARKARAIQQAVDARVRATAPKEPQNVPGSGAVSRTSTPTDFKAALAPRMGGINPYGKTGSWIANPPPTGNQSLQTTTTTRLPSMRSAIAPNATGNEGNAYADNALRNAKALYAPHDTTTTTREAYQPPLIEGGPGRTVPEKQSNILFGEINPASKAAGTGAPAWTPYGMISSTTSTGNKPIRPGIETATGVSRAPDYKPKDYAQEKASLYEKHPNIFKAGTPENEAFVAHYKKYGPEATFAGVDALMNTLTPRHASATGATAQSAKDDIPSTGARTPYTAADASTNPVTAPTAASQWPPTGGAAARPKPGILAAFPPIRR